MKQFMLFIREDLEAVKKLTEEELQADIALMIKWVEGLSASGHYVQGDPLEPEVHVAKKDGILTDGPFIESKEAVSGYMIIKADNLKQASEIAQSCPTGIWNNVRSIEVRPIMTF